jgi:hypothetical protein
MKKNVISWQCWFAGWHWGLPVAKPMFFPMMTTRRQAAV